MCGLPCSGKTTRAREIEREHDAVRLTPDEWLTGLLGQDMPEAQLFALRNPIEVLHWGLAERLLTLGVDVVVDFGVWSREERERFRGRAREIGARSELHFMDVPAAVLLERLTARNAALPPDAFFIKEAWLRDWLPLFEPPDAGELRPREPA